MTKTQTTTNFTATGVFKTYDDGSLAGWIGVDMFYNQAGVTRPNTHGWALGPDTPARRKLAQRLIAAINAGVVETDHKILTDIEGGTYVGAEGHHVYGKTVNADLNRLGY